MRTRTNRAVAVVTAAALALTSAGIAPAFAAGKPAPQAQPVQLADYELSSYHRHRYDGHRHHNAAVAAAIIGAVGAYAAARHYRKHGHDGYYAPYGGYGYNGGGPYYGPRYRYW